MARISDEKEEEKKRGGVIPPWGGAPTSGSLIRASASGGRGAGQGSWFSRLFGGRGLGQLPLFPQILPGQGFFGLTLSNLLASKLGLMGAIAALLGVSAAAGTYYKNIISPRPSGSLGFRRNPFRGGALPTDRKGYDNSMMLFNEANKGALPEGPLGDEAAASSEESSDDKNVISGPPSDTADPNALAQKLAQSQGLPGQTDNPLDPKKYSSSMGPFGGGGGYFQGQSGSGSGGAGALGGLPSKGLNVPKGLGGTTTAMGRKPAVSFGARSGAGSRRRGRSAFGDLADSRNMSAAGARKMGLSPSVGSYNASQPFDVGGTRSTGGEPMGIGGGTPIGSGITSGPDTTSGGGRPGTPNNTTSGGPTDTGGHGSDGEPQVPAVPGDKDVTPWGGLAKLAQTLMIIASALLLIAYLVSKIKPWGYGVAKWIAYIAMALAAVVTILGIMIMTQYGQMMQGGIFTVVGAILTYLAYTAAEENAKAAAAQEEAKMAAMKQAAADQGLKQIGNGFGRSGRLWKWDAAAGRFIPPKPPPVRFIQV